jgi:NAD-dependent dihydropyrimidine dehydrogenase PreA subunit
MGSQKLSRQRKNKFIHLETSRCDACWDCIEVCPKQVFGKIDLLWHRHAIIRNAEACNGCKKCVRACESGALEYIYVPKSQSDGRNGERPAVRSGTDSV